MRPFLHCPSFAPWLPLFLVAAVGAGCGPHSNSSTSNPQLKENFGVDLTQVAGFVIAPPNTGVVHVAVADGGQAPDELYALGTDGTLTVVSVVDEPSGGQSSDTTQVVPQGVFNTPGYVFLAYQGVNHGAVSCPFVLARKSDGSLYCLTGVSPWQTPMVPFSPLDRVIETDATGNIVWMNLGQTVSRVDLADPTNLTVTQAVVTNVSFNGGGQAVNAAGDDLVSGLTGSLPFLRVLLPSGGFFNVSADQNIGCLSAGGTSGANDLYYSDNTSWETTPTLVKLTWTAPDSFTPTPIAGSKGCIVDCNAGVARAGTHVLFSHAATISSPAFTQFIDLNNDVPTVQVAAPLTSTQKIAACPSTAFVIGTDAAGNGGIVAYDLASSAFSTLLAPGDYALTAMDVADSCEVTFYGQRASDGAFILGTVPAGGGAVSVIATGFPTVTQIQRMN